MGQVSGILCLADFLSAEIMIAVRWNLVMQTTWATNAEKLMTHGLRFDDDDDFYKDNETQMKDVFLMECDDEEEMNYKDCIVKILIHVCTWMNLQKTDAIQSDFFKVISKHIQQMNLWNVCNVNKSFNELIKTKRHL